MTLAGAQLCHQIPGRFRVKVPARRRDAAYFLKASECISRCDGVISVAAQPLTGSLLIGHTGSIEAVARFAEEQGLFHLVADPTHGPAQDGTSSPQPSSPHQGSWLGAAGTPAFDSALAAALAALGLYQILQGEVMAPAITLFWYAYVAMRSGQPDGAGRAAGRHGFAGNDG